MDDKDRTQAMLLAEEEINRESNSGVQTVMKRLGDIAKAEAREEFENQLRFAFVKYDNLDDEEDNIEVIAVVYIT
ncbi:unnamed protein product [Arctia plantaginis]|uniref:Uncharacterized protein n=1 Tax=Arctia plantaginis TaxID=874455 RepID=A0A8S0Z264_ARCPL|nr:unnamed protein product [Arctia plantaginis]